MIELKAKKREPKFKSKQLRKQGLVPAVLYGKHLEESIPVEITSSDLAQFMKSNTVGSKLTLVIGRKKYLALLKEYTTAALSSDIEHLSFLALTATEKVTSSARIVVHNRDSIRNGIVQHSLDEITFKALPSDLVDHIDVDIADMNIGDIISVSDLPIAANDAIEIITPLDSIIVTVSAPKEFVEEAPESEEASAAESETGGDAAQEQTSGDAE